MSHCFVEGIAPAAATTSSCPSGVSGASLTSFTSLPSLLALASSEFLCICNQPADDFRENRTGKKKIHAEKRHCRGHHDVVGNHIGPRRPFHLPQFHAHVVQK